MVNQIWSVMEVANHSLILSIKLVAPILVLLIAIRGRLEVAWTFDTGDWSDGSELPSRSAFEATPLVIDGVEILDRYPLHSAKLSFDHPVTGASLRELMALVNRSLLHCRPDRPRDLLRSQDKLLRAGRRYEMHELLRQFVTEKLDRSPDGGAGRPSAERPASVGGS